MKRMFMSTVLALGLAHPAFADLTMTQTSTVTSAEATPLAGDLFAPPAGYQLSPKK